MTLGREHPDMVSSLLAAGVDTASTDKNGLFLTTFCSLQPSQDDRFVPYNLTALLLLEGLGF